MKFIAAIWLAAAVVLGLSPETGAARTRMQPGAEPIALESKQIDYFRIGHRDQIRFGQLEYLGGFELWSKNRHFGAVSGIASLDGGDRIIAVSDNGFWFDLTIDSDSSGRPVAIAKARLAPMLDARGEPISNGHDADAEGLAIVGAPPNQRFLVTFERNHRIVSYPADMNEFLGPVEKYPTPRGASRLRHNRGLESIAVVPRTCKLPGQAITIAERDRNRSADVPAWIVGGKKARKFRIRLVGDFSVTDAAFLPNGDLVILERRFNFAEGVAMRLRQIPCAALKAGTVADGAVLMEADFGHQIDNMEGLAIHTDQKGDAIFTVMSDDNRSILQRTLLLRFRLKEPPRPPEKVDIGLRPSTSPPAAGE